MRRNDRAKWLTEGRDETDMLWNAINDLNIAKFWAIRGMTDEDAIKKFGHHIKWPKRRKK